MRQKCGAQNELFGIALARRRNILEACIDLGAQILGKDVELIISANK